MEGSARLALIPIVVCERIQHLRGSNLLLPPRPSKLVFRLPLSQQTLHNLLYLLARVWTVWTVWPWLGWPDGFGLFGLGLAGQMAQAGGDPRAHESPGR